MPAVKIAATLSAAVLLCSIAPHPPRFNAPKLILWAWERPEDLRFINTRTTGVAYLAATLLIQPDGSVHIKPRLQPLKLPPHMEAISVFRIETAVHYVVPNLDSITDIMKTAAAIQIDFDARASERAFYRALLANLRRATNRPVGITALASWCEDDNWLNGEPIFEAVPMFFRMGHNEFRNMPIESRVCSSSTGVSLDEPWPPAKPDTRLYVFNPRPWTRADYAAVTQHSKDWR